jgi:hypothetical protein
MGGTVFEGDTADAILSGDVLAGSVAETRTRFPFLPDRRG